MARLRPSQTSLLAALAVVLLVQATPGGQYVLLPLLFLNTHMHELGHAIAAFATGGQASYILVRADGSGATPVVGGWLPAVASAGYVGTSLAGALLLAVSRTAEGARRGLLWLAALMLLAQVALVRGDLVGVATGWAWTVALFLLARRLKDEGLVFAGQFAGATLCLASWQAFLALFAVSPGGHSDAALMQAATGVPAPVWAGAWLVLSTVLVLLGLRKAWSE